MKWRNGYYLIVSLLCFLIDRLSKYWITTHMALGDSLSLNAYLNITHAQNRGAAFSFLAHAGGWQHIVFVSLSIIIPLFLLYHVLTSDNCPWSLWGASSIIGGAIGNLCDRLQSGSVTDFIDVHVEHMHFATFNMADSAITLGVILLFIGALRHEHFAGESSRLLRGR